jgi:hypothetical protein
VKGEGRKGGKGGRERGRGARDDEIYVRIVVLLSILVPGF